MAIERQETSASEPTVAQSDRARRERRRGDDLQRAIDVANARITGALAGLDSQYWCTTEGHRIVEIVRGALTHDASGVVIRTDPAVPALDSARHSILRVVGQFEFAGSGTSGHVRRAWWP